MFIQDMHWKTDKYNAVYFRNVKSKTNEATKQLVYDVENTQITDVKS